MTDINNYGEIMKDAYDALVVKGIIDSPPGGKVSLAILMQQPQRGEIALWLARAMSYTAGYSAGESDIKNKLRQAGIKDTKLGSPPPPPAKDT